LGFHDVDPIRYELIFERFISSESTSLPDIDLDVESSRREEVFAFLEDLYKGQTAQVCTFTRFKQQSLVNGLTKAIGMDILEENMLEVGLKTLPDVPTPLEKLVQVPNMEYLNQKYHLVDHYHYMYGQISHRGKHPAGIVIADADITNYLAIKRQGSGKEISFVTSYDMAGVSDLGLLKIDLLGLDDWTILSQAEKDAQFRYGIDYNSEFLHDTLLKDAEMLQAFGRGDTLGIPQSEKRTPRNMYKKVKPTGLNDLAAVSALNRPVPLSEKSFDRFVQGKKGQIEKAFWHDAARSTYGALVYQESVMEICTKYAGMDQKDADKVLKLLKRYHENDIVLENKFVGGIVMNNFANEEEARKLWNTCRRYLFNGGHAFSYGILAARMMYLKIHYPMSFYLSLLQSESEKDKRRVYIGAAYQAGIKVLIPHVNGEANYSKLVLPSGEYLQEGLINIEGIGLKSAERIQAERVANGPYLSKEDVVSRLPGMTAIINKLEHFSALDFTEAYQDKCVQYMLQVLAHAPNYL